MKPCRSSRISVFECESGAFSQLVVPGFEDIVDCTGLYVTVLVKKKAKYVQLWVANSLSNLYKGGDDLALAIQKKVVSALS